MLEVFLEVAFGLNIQDDVHLQQRYPPFAIAISILERAFHLRQLVVVPDGVVEVAAQEEHVALIPDPGLLVLLELEVLLQLIGDGVGFALEVGDDVLEFEVEHVQFLAHFIFDFLVFFGLDNLEDVQGVEQAFHLCAVFHLLLLFGIGLVVIVEKAEAFSLVVVVVEFINFFFRNLDFHQRV